jgi:uncharacterized protein (DUF58 family)
LALCLGLALALGRPSLAVVAAAPAAFLIAGGRRPAPAVEAGAAADAQWAVEDDAVRVTVRVHTDAPVDAVRIEARHSAPIVADPPVCVAGPGTDFDVELRYRADRWGRSPLGGVVVTAYADGLRRASSCAVPLPDVTFAPRPAPVRAVPLRPTRLGAVGEHPGRPGDTGVEFAGTRPYLPGDPARRVHWPTTLRRGQLQVLQGVGEYAVDVVLVVDGLADVGPVGGSSLDLGVRGALGIAQALLRQRDRVGMIVLGGWLRWLRPAYGQRQFTRMMTGLLEARRFQTYVDPDVAAAAAVAVPPGTRVIVFSPLTDERAVAAVIRLRDTGSPVTVVDVLPEIPEPARPLERIARRAWLLERAALQSRLAARGIAVVRWDGAGPLELVLAPVTSRSVAGA